MVATHGGVYPDSRGRVVLDLGDRDKTYILNDSAEVIQLLNKLVEINSGPKFKNLTHDEKVEQGYGVHVAATTDAARGHTASQIDLRQDDGALSQELMTLVELASLGGPNHSASDINLRLGEVSNSDEEGVFIEVLVDGKWTTDTLRIEGGLAQDLFEAMPELAPEEPEPVVEPAAFTPPIIEADDPVDAQPPIETGRIVTRPPTFEQNLEIESFSLGRDGGVVSSDPIIELASRNFGSSPAQGASGDDTIDGNASAEEIYGDAYRIVAQRGPETVFASDGVLGAAADADADPSAWNPELSVGSILGEPGAGDEIAAVIDQNQLFGEPPAPHPDLDSLAGLGTHYGGHDQIHGHDGDDVIYGDAESFENIGEGARLAAFEGGSDALQGGAGDDVIFGDVRFAAGDLSAEGTIVTGGDDLIEGGAGDDRLYGDLRFTTGKVDFTGGRDTFVFAPGSGMDVIYDFERGKDLIDVSGYGITSFAQLEIVHTSGDVVVRFGGEEGVRVIDVNELDHTDFVFA